MEPNFITEGNAINRPSPRRFETQREIGGSKEDLTQGDKDSWMDKTIPFKKEESDQPKSPPLRLLKQETAEIRFENNLRHLNKGFGNRFNQTQVMQSPQSATLITNKNVLSKRALDALNATQQMFPFH